MRSAPTFLWIVSCVVGTIFLQIRAYEDRQLQPPRDIVRSPGQSQTQPVKVRRPRQSSIGTAFIVGDGVWITARHVIENCETVEVNHPRSGWSSFESLESHKMTDIAYVKTRPTIHNSRRFESISLSLASPEVGDIGYVHGFPQGVEADREQQFIGSDWGKYQGDSRRYKWDVWAGRSSNGLSIREHWGGSSGGPVLNELGQLVGVNVGGNPRRGTTLSISVRELAEFLERNSIRFSYSGENGFSERIDEKSYPRYGRQLRNEGAVSLIACNRTSRKSLRSFGSILMGG